MIIDPTDLDATQNYKLLVGSILPRPIAWVSTRSSDGVDNLAPISFFTAVGRKPPRVHLSLQARHDRMSLKDTFVNIRDTREFVINMSVLPLADEMHRSSAEFDSYLDEFEVLGVAKESCVVVKPPRVKESPISFECKLVQILSREGSYDNIVWGEVVRFHIRDDLYLPNGRIDTAAIPVIGRLAGEYSLIDNAFTTPLDPTVLSAHEGRRMKRLDDHPDGYSPIDTPAWSPSGSALH